MNERSVGVLNKRETTKPELYSQKCNGGVFLGQQFLFPLNETRVDDPKCSSQAETYLSKCNTQQRITEKDDTFFLKTSSKCSETSSVVLPFEH